MNTEDQIKEKNNQEASHKSNWAIGISATVLVLFVVLFLIYRNDYKNQITVLQGDAYKLNANLSTRDSMINSYMGDFNDIESTIDSIKIRENIISTMSNGYNEGISGDKKTQIIADIKYMNHLLQKDKKQISKLQSKLSKSGMRLIQFEARLRLMEKRIEERDSSLASLKRILVDKNIEITQLNQDLDMMDGQIQQQADIIQNNLTEFYKAHYVVGSFKELKKKEVITWNGGFLGFGRNVFVASVSPDSSFTTIDIRRAVLIQVDSKSAKLISNHPKGSYKWIEKDNKISDVQITDPTNFWKYTHYAVLETN